MHSFFRHRFLEETGGRDNGSDDDDDTSSLVSAIVSNILLFFLIFGLSATVRIQDLRHQLTNKMAIGTGVAMQFLIMPFLGFLSVITFHQSGLSEAMGITLLVVTASPGGSYSNWWCNLFNAELALSVAMTSVSSLLSMGLLPLNLFFYSWLSYSVVLEPEGGDEDLDIIQSLDYTAIFISLGVVLSAIVSGLYVGSRFNSAHFHERANHFGSFCGLALILFSVFLGSGGGDAETNFWSLPWGFFAGVIFPCVLGITLANVVARCSQLSPPEVVAISIECCYQNTAIATSVAITMFSDPDERAEAVSVPLLYGFVEAAVIGIYCVWAWKVGWTKAPASEKLCVVMTKTYEVGTEEDDEDNWNGELPKNWFARLFIPRNIEEHFNKSGSSDSIAEDIPDKKEELSRDRFESADVTISTVAATPPGTPDNLSINEANALVSKQSENSLLSNLEPQISSKGSLTYPTYPIEESADEQGCLDYSVDLVEKDRLNTKAQYGELLTDSSVDRNTVKNLPDDGEKD